MAQVASVLLESTTKTSSKSASAFRHLAMLRSSFLVMTTTDTGILDMMLSFQEAPRRISGWNSSMTSRQCRSSEKASARPGPSAASLARMSPS